MILFRLYINALVRGNPLAVGVTILGAVALAMGPFHEGLSRRDPAAVGLAAFAVVGMVIVLTIAIVDRKLNPPEKKRRKSGKAKKR